MPVTCKEALDYLEKNELSKEEHLRLLSILTRRVNAFPLENVITTSQQGTLLANGREMTLDEVVKFRQGISALRDNWAFQLLGDQILFLAIQHGVHFGDTVEKIYFSKASIYFISKFRELIQTFDR